MASAYVGGVAAAFCRCSQRWHRVKRASGAHSDADAVQGFVAWMEASGIVTSKKLQIVPDEEEGRCVKSIAAIEKGEVLVQLPQASAASVQMSDTAGPGEGLEPLAGWWLGCS